ncbi:hypothetical protein GCM10010166_58000 [Couchioplanes caeruleus subsp. azureus]|nr:hypothetical protein GCM10010166_58000 [Couchioplanes caeruleus subsp. azureus]
MVHSLRPSHRRVPEVPKNQTAELPGTFQPVPATKAATTPSAQFKALYEVRGAFLPAGWNPPPRTTHRAPGPDGIPLSPTEALPADAGGAANP